MTHLDQVISSATYHYEETLLRALLNKSNIWPGRGSDHSPSVKIATFRG
ncbi:MAG: hypothetical protein G5700_05245, partial [Serratia symbiotica]|nr:hypothetical protein [Serratia symbiotica]